MKKLSFVVTAAFLVTAVMPAVPTVEAANTTMYHIVSTGQSLSLGAGGAPALSTTQPYDNVMLSGNSFVELKESGNETMSSGMANTLTSLTTLDHRFAVTRNGVSGAVYASIKKGTASFTNGINHVTTVKNAAAQQNLTSRVIAVTAIHGESDQIYSTTTAQYEENLKQWQIDYSTDIKAITGQSQDVPLFTDQMTAYARTTGAPSDIPLAQLAAAENNPGKVIMVTPKYFMTYTDGVHMNNSSYRLLGEYYGKVIKKVIFDGQTWKPLSPLSIERQGAVINAKFHVPAGSLEFDTTRMAAKTNKGFNVTGSTNSATISSVEIVGSDTVKITLNKVPTGNLRLTYGYNGIATAGGNLRDTDSTPSIHGSKLYNWAVLFDKPVTEVAASSSSSAVSSNSSAISSIASSHSSISSSHSSSNSSFISSSISSSSSSNSSNSSSSSVSFSSSSIASSLSSSSVSSNGRAQCNDGMDNDGDGRIDFQNGFGDYGCDSILDASEGPNPECSDGIDNLDTEDNAADNQDFGCYFNGFYTPRGVTENNSGSSSSSSSTSSAKFSIKVTDDESTVKAGNDLKYEITVTNKSNFTVTNMTVTNEISKYVDFDDCSHNCSKKKQKQTWSGLTFGPNEKKKFIVEAEVLKKGKGETLKTTARVANKSDKDTTKVKK